MTRRSANSLNAGRGSFVLMDGKGRVLAADTAFLHRLDLLPDSVVGRPATTLLPPGLRSRAEAHIAAAATEVLSWRGRIGGTRLEVSLHPILNHYGRPVRIIARIRDVNGHGGRRNRAGETLLHDEALFRSIFAQTAAGMIQVDAADRIVRANAYFCRWLGYAEAELQRSTFTDLLHHDDRSGHGLAVQRLWAGVIDHHHVAAQRYRHKDGTMVWGQTRLGMIANDTFRFLVPVVHDVPNRSTTPALPPMQEATGRIGARFLAAAGHDLRQPLQTVSLFVNVLTQRLQDPRQHGIIVKIEAALEVWRDMLNALLEVSKLETGLFTVRRTLFELDLLLERLAGEYAPAAAAKGLVVHRVPCRLQAYSDSVLLERLLRPLLANALRYTDRGHLLVGCRRAGDYVRVQVWDTGIGIAEDQVGVIFQDFQRKAYGRHKGLGLGLAIVDRLSHLLDHPVTVCSKMGKGSMFEVRLPCYASRTVTQGRINEDAETRCQPPSHIGPDKPAMKVSMPRDITRRLVLVGAPVWFSILWPAACHQTDHLVVNMDSPFNVMGAHPPFGLGASVAERARQGFFLARAGTVPAGLPRPLIPISVLRPDESTRRMSSPALDPAPVVAATLVEERRPGVRLTTPGGPLVIGRTTSVPLPVFPFLKFHWRLHDPDTADMEDAPVSVLVGFADGEGATMGGTESLLPPHQRLLSVVWSGRVAERGRFTGRGAQARFVVQSGARRFEWWEHDVDLSDLHRHLWPAVRRENVRTVFVALAVDESRRQTITEVNALVLSR